MSEMPMESEVPLPKRRAWAAGVLLSIVQMGLVWLLGTVFGHADFFSGVAFCLCGLELIAGIAWWWGGTFSYQGRVLVFAALFPVALLATVLLVFGGICMIQGRGFYG